MRQIEKSKTTVHNLNRGGILFGLKGIHGKNIFRSLMYIEEEDGWLEETDQDELVNPMGMTRMETGNNSREDNNKQMLSKQVYNRGFQKGLDKKSSQLQYFLLSRGKESLLKGDVINLIDEKEKGSREISTKVTLIYTESIKRDDYVD